MEASKVTIKNQTLKASELTKLREQRAVEYIQDHIGETISLSEWTSILNLKSNIGAFNLLNRLRDRGEIIIHDNGPGSPNSFSLTGESTITKEAIKTITIDDLEVKAALYAFRNCVPSSDTPEISSHSDLKAFITFLKHEISFT